MEEEQKTEPVNEEVIQNEQSAKKVNGKGHKAYIIVIVVIALAISYGCGFVLGKKLYEKDNKQDNSPKPVEQTDEKQDNNQEDKKEDNKEENKVVEITQQEEEVNKLLEYLPSIKMNLNGIKQYSVYQNKKITLNDVDSEILIENAIKHTDERKTECTNEETNANGLCDFTIKTDDVKKTLKQLYGDNNITLKSKIKGSGLLTCTIVKDNYACSNTGGGWTATELELYFNVLNSEYTKYLKSEKDDNNLYIYEAYLNYRFNDIADNEVEKGKLDNYKFKLYKYSNTNDLLVNEELSGKDFYDTSSTFKEKIFNYLGDKYITYKHTYKINDDGSYSWIATESIN